MFWWLNCRPETMKCGCKTMASPEDSGRFSFTPVSWTVVWCSWCSPWVKPCLFLTDWEFFHKINLLRNWGKETKRNHSISFLCCFRIFCWTTFPWRGNQRKTKSTRFQKWITIFPSTNAAKSHEIPFNPMKFSLNPMKKNRKFQALPHQVWDFGTSPPQCPSRCADCHSPRRYPSRGEPPSRGG